MTDDFDALRRSKIDELQRTRALEEIIDLPGIEVLRTKIQLLMRRANEQVLSQTTDTLDKVAAARARYDLGRELLAVLDADTVRLHVSNLAVELEGFARNDKDAING